MYDIHSDFQTKFGIDALKQARDNDKLLETMFLMGKHDDMCYALEYQNNDCGAIWGGSAYKYILRYNQDTKEWSKTSKDEIIHEEEAKEIAGQIVDLFSQAYDIFAQNDDPAEIQNKIKVLTENRKNDCLKNLFTRSWVHKYFHMLFPKKLCAIHNAHMMYNVYTLATGKEYENNTQKNMYELSCLLSKLAAERKMNNEDFMRIEVDKIKDSATYWIIEKGELSKITKKPAYVIYNKQKLIYVVDDIYVSGDVSETDDNILYVWDDEKALKNDLLSYGIQWKKFSSREITSSNDKKYSKFRKLVEHYMKKESYPLDQILYGPPGTGKTYNAKKVALTITHNNSDNISFVTFHQSYSYEDFVEGLKPVIIDKNGEEITKDDKNYADSKLIYKVKDGVFKKLCNEALSHSENNYVMIIDEINRGNVSKIFGELITLIEESKRADGSDECSVTLPYSHDTFTVPDNVYIIGTMNTADRSIALLDTALRRRFEFVEMMPDPDKLGDAVIKSTNNDKPIDIDLKELLTAINTRIGYLYDREHTIGHAYLMKNGLPITTFEELKNAFKNKIIPLLQEYFFDDYEKIKLVLNDTKGNFISDDPGKAKYLTAIGEYESDKKLYRIKDADEWSGEAFVNIYATEANSNEQK